MKLIKYIGVFFGALLILSSSVYGAFLLSEYVSGNRFVNYLEQHQESKSLQEPFTFELMENDLNTKSLVLVGEIHGFKVPTEFDIEFFSYLNKQHGFSTYLLEMDFSHAYFMNQYNQTGDEELLSDILKNWVVWIGQENLDYKKRWQNLRKLYQSGHPFVYLGTDRISDVGMLFKHLNALSNAFDLQYDANLPDDSQLQLARAEIQRALESHTFSEQTSWQINHLQTNIEAKLQSVRREPLMTENLLSIYQHYDLFNKKVYGFYGIGHTLLDQIAEGHTPMPARLIQRDNWFKDNTLSINMLFADSYMTVHSQGLPSFMQSDGPYTKLPVSYDNILTHYAYGIMDLLRATNPTTKTLFKLDAPSSPYKQSQRLFKAYRVLPLGQKMSAKEGSVTADYGQYALFIRDSDWAEPIVN